MMSKAPGELASWDPVCQGRISREEKCLGGRGGAAERGWPDRSRSCAGAWPQGSHRASPWLEGLSFPEGPCVQGYPPWADTGALDLDQEAIAQVAGLMPGIEVKILLS